MSSLNIAKHTPHRAYWAEQQSRLPLPLMELMENEALEILTKALRSELPANPQELPRQILVDFAGLGPKGWGFRVPYVLSDALGTHKYSKGPIKVKS